MARAIWTGSLSFGLVSIPVGLYSATEDKAIRFHQFQEGTTDRVRNKRVNERTGEEVEYSEIVKGYDIGGGEYVIVTPEELEAVEPGPTRTIEIVDFVDLESIDPIYYKSTYYLAPQGNDAQRAYELLRHAMSATKKVGIATLVMRSKQHLVAVRPEEKVLALETMFFHDEVRDPAREIGTLPGELTFKPREIDTAKLLIDSMSADWNADNYADTYRQRVEELIDRKRQGEVVVTGGDTRPAAPVVDLMDALQASVEAARNHRPGNADVSPLVAAPGRKAKAAAGSSARTSGGGRGTGRQKSGEDLSALSKAELAKRATALGIEGRSKMSREELESAVARASAPSAPARRRKAS
ncbi:MAG TPA: Ku protein [Acidimicrobiales bacterium]|nr:Ku protein [Acidimicrobiales bacterium]